MSDSLNITQHNISHVNRLVNRVAKHGEVMQESTEVIFNLYWQPNSFGDDLTTTKYEYF